MKFESTLVVSLRQQIHNEIGFEKVAHIPCKHMKEYASDQSRILVADLS